MDPAQGESGGRSLVSKMKAKVKSPGMKDKVKNLRSKVKIPGMKGHGGEAGGEDSSEYDDESPRGQAPGPETGYNVGESTPYSTVEAKPVTPEANAAHSQMSTSTYETQSRDFEKRPSYTNTAAYDAQSYGTNMQQYPSSGYRTAAPPQRPPPQVTDPRVPGASGLEERFNHLDVGESSPRVDNHASDRSFPTSASETMISSSPNKPAVNKLTSVKDSIVGSAAAAATVVGSKMGYYKDEGDTPSVPRDPNAPTILDKTKATLGLDKRRDPNAPSMVDRTKATLGLDKPADPNAPSMMDKTKATLGMDKPKDPDAPTLLEKTKATLGLDTPRDPNSPTATEKAKAYMASATETAKGYGAAASDHAAWTKDRVAAQTTPTHHDKALSEQVTQTLSNLPGTIREKVWGPTSPSSKSATSPKAGSPGVVDRVSGAISSLWSTSPKESTHDVQHTFPAHTDYVKPAATTPQTFAERSSAEERMPTSSTPAYPMVNN